MYERQRAYRDRQAAKAREHERLQVALLDIIAKLDGNTKPMALEITRIANAALGLDPPPQR